LLAQIKRSGLPTQMTRTMTGAQVEHGEPVGA
jgi:hypothetical protein